MIYLIMFFVFNILQSNPMVNVGIDEKLGKMVDLNLTFTNSEGEKVLLKDLVSDKPTVISLVYYRCPGICNVLLDGLRDVVQRSDIEPGIDYNIISLSFDHSETWDLARDKKKNYLDGMSRKINPAAWKWVVGDSTNVKSLTEQVGFKYIIDNYRKDQTDFLHVGALIFIAPDGKVIRYLMGTTFLPFDFKMASVEAGRGTPQATISKVLDLCFKYDPDGRSYKLATTRIAGVLMLLMLGGFIFWLVKSKRKKELVNE